MQPGVCCRWGALTLGKPRLIGSPNKVSQNSSWRRTPHGQLTKSHTWSTAVCARKLLQQLYAQLSSAGIGQAQGHLKGLQSRGWAKKRGRRGSRDGYIRAVHCKRHMSGQPPQVYSGKCRSGRRAKRS